MKIVFYKLLRIKSLLSWLTALIISAVIVSCSGSNDTGAPLSSSEPINVNKDDLRLVISSESIENSPVTLANGGVVKVTNPCQLLIRPEITIYANAPGGDLSTGIRKISLPSYAINAILPVYYDKKVDRLEIIDGVSQYNVPVTAAIIDPGDNVIYPGFSFDVIFPPCDISDSINIFTNTGLGTREVPYKIKGPFELELVSYLINNDEFNNGWKYIDKFYELSGDIDLGVSRPPWLNEDGLDRGFHPIASNTGNYGFKFSGSFDCRGYTISNLYIDRGRQDNVGLFGNSVGTVKNCSLINVNVRGGTNVGGLIGRHSADVGLGGLISNTYVTGTVAASGHNIGGLVGSNKYSTIRNSYFTGVVLGSNNVGGLAGYNIGLIEDAYATGSVIGSVNVGGLVGEYKLVPGIRRSIANSYVANSIFGTDGSIYLGHLIGKFTSDTPGVISSVYYNSDTTITVNGVSLENNGVGFPSDDPNINAYYSARELTRINPLPLSSKDLLSGKNFFRGWSEEIWDFSAGYYPRLKSVPCPNRQHLEPTPTSCGDLQKLPSPVPF
ncbi:hypothetical protein COTS27_00980 [Spirochaetota bacterium]|nr:hypothetical protein COTS27_00980 [Spirochaetota bacterium]